MKIAKLSKMKRGWFIGDFEPNLYKTEAWEVGVKCYDKGYKGERHYHKVATEHTCVLQGRIKMNGKEFKKDDIIILSPGEITDFEVLDDNTVTVVVKIPGVKNDKYIVEE